MTVAEPIRSQKPGASSVFFTWVQHSKAWDCSLPISQATGRDLYRKYISWHELVPIWDPRACKVRTFSLRLLCWAHFSNSSLCPCDFQVNKSVKTGRQKIPKSEEKLYFIGKYIIFFPREIVLVVCVSFIIRSITFARFQEHLVFTVLNFCWSLQLYILLASCYHPTCQWIYNVFIRVCHINEVLPRSTVLNSQPDEIKFHSSIHPFCALISDSTLHLKTGQIPW